MAGSGGLGSCKSLRYPFHWHVLIKVYMRGLVIDTLDNVPSTNTEYNRGSILKDRFQERNRNEFLVAK